jgi:hypothetical protein
MKTNHWKIMYTVVFAVLFGAAAFIATQSNNAVQAFEKKGNDADIAEKNCERIDTPESSTFGKCKNVCEGKTVTWDAVGRRWVCGAKAIVKHPPVNRPPGATLEVKPKTAAPGANTGKSKQ